jgi:hypothetical protein
MRGFYSGLVAGCIGGLVFTVVRVLETISGLYALFPVLTFDALMIHLGYAMPANGIYGGIFAIIYSMFYDRVPGKGVKKSFVFGLMMFFISNIWIASDSFLLWLFTRIETLFEWSYSWSIEGSTIWIPYGIVLGLLYERWKR